jgi:D-aminoacyl-tRNA deacylase
MKCFVLISSRTDPAGTNIFSCLVENFGFEKTEDYLNSSPIYRFQNLFLASMQGEIVNERPELDARFASVDCVYVFLSRHRAESGIPSLTGHFTGNFGAADFGGKPKEIARYSASTLKQYLTELQLLKGRLPPKYNLTLEATHHGPTESKKPLIFIELGSTETEWNDTNASKQIAQALILALSKQEKRYSKCAIGLGGMHYPEKFNKVEFLDPEIAMGTIVPKYSLENLDEKMMKQIVEKSDERISIAAIDKKGLGKEKNRIIELVDSFGLEILNL